MDNGKYTGPQRAERPPQPNNKTAKAPATGQTTWVEAIVGILTGIFNNASIGAYSGLDQGIKNIEAMMRISGEKKDSAIPGTGEKVAGLMAFRRYHKNLSLAFVGGQAPAFYLPLDKLVLLVEQMHDTKLRTVIIRNCSEDSDSDYARGQVLAKLNDQYSALQVVWGDNGVVVEGENDINKRANYYINPDELLIYYLAAKVQLKGGSQLEELLQANEGWRKYDIPTNPLDPGAA